MVCQGIDIWQDPWNRSPSKFGVSLPVSFRDINAMSSLQGYIDRTLLSFHPQLN